MTEFGGPPGADIRPASRRARSRPARTSAGTLPGLPARASPPRYEPARYEPPSWTTDTAAASVRRRRADDRIPGSCLRPARPAPGRDRPARRARVVGLRDQRPPGAPDDRTAQR